VVFIKTKKIFFTGVHKAELLEVDVRELAEQAILNMIAAGRVQVAPIVSRVVSPTDAPEIFNQLCDDPAFPMGAVFDWREIV